MARNGVFKTSLDYYKAFYYVAKFKSISLAAKKLGLSQPSMSSTIKKMETDLGCRLFERNRYGAEMTMEGELLWKKVGPACDLILEAETELDSAYTLGGGTINLVAYEQGYLIYIMPALKKYLKDYPDVKVNLMSATPEQMVEMVRLGLADMTILFSPIIKEDDFKYTKVGELREKLAVGTEYKDLLGRKLDLRELSNYSFITYSSGTSKRHLQQWFENEGLIFQPQTEVTGVSLMRQAIIDNYGIGNIYPPMAEAAEKEGQLFFLDITQELPKREVYAVTRKDCAKYVATFVKEYM